ncbi:MAG: GH92 family glycosyl hydrolase [Bacteroidales bacterium]|nr:GH92 family glycosyl hydrolase [Bacteroidales bacterium]
MKKLNKFFPICVLFTLVLITSYAVTAQNNKTKKPSLVDLVNPFVGTDAHGHTYPGAIAPFGAVQLSPDTRLSGWDGCSGYHWTDSICYGFSHTHLSGTGCSDYGDILFFPTSSSDVSKQYGSVFKKQNEKARAGYYEVLLQDEGILAQLTATQRCGWHSYTYKQGSQRCLLIDLKHRDVLLKCSWKMADSNTIVGQRNSRAWNENQVLYFAARFSLPIKHFLWDENTKKLLLIFAPATQNDITLECKVALSSVNEDGALANLKSEPQNTFSDALNAATDLWNAQLGRIEVKGGTEESRKNFYTALYHSSVCPNLYSDVSGKYRGMDNKIHKAKNYDRYSVFSLWDTYRTLHPLLAIIDRKRSSDFANTMLDIFKQADRLPMWELSNFETYCMIGEHGISVLSDLFMKGIRPNDKLTLDAMLTTFDNKRRKKIFDKHNRKEYKYFGLDYFNEMGFIPAEKEHESVSKTIEYCYNAHCIAQVATTLYNEAVSAKRYQDTLYYKQVSEKYNALSQNWISLLNPSSGFIEPREGQRFSPTFDPTEINRHFTEGNAWHYTFYMPHDVNTYAQYLGGLKALDAKLDSCFNASSVTSGREQADVTGMIGQYCQGNEPSQHTAYLYAYCGEQWKSTAVLRRITDSLYSPKPDGLCGNDDCGQMSAWFVMTALGFYPVNPVSNQYVIGSPLFDTAIIHLESGKQFVVTAEGASQKPYIQSATLNSKPYTKTWITYNDIMDGGTLNFVMGKQPNIAYGAAKADRPFASVGTSSHIAVPYFEYKGTNAFDSVINVEIKSVNEQDSIFVTAYRTDNKAFDTIKTKGRNIKLTFDHSARVIAYAKTKEGRRSNEVSVDFYQVSSGRSLKVFTHYDNQYSANGDFALIDRQKGSTNWRIGNWQGYQGEDVVAIIDLGKTFCPHKIEATFLQDVRSWIFMPDSVEYSFSSDGQNFTPVQRIANTLSPKDETITIKGFSIVPKAPMRYIKMHAYNRKITPADHLSPNQPAWIFIDEISIEE